MIDDGSPYKLDFSLETREAIEREFCRMAIQAVADSEARNSQLQVWRDQLEGFGITAGNTTWANACDYFDSLSMKSFLTLLAQFVGALHRDPKVAVESFTQDEEDGARVLERYLAVESSRSQVDARIYDLGFDACWAPTVVGYMGWKQITRRDRDVGYQREGDARVYSEEEREDGVEYEAVPVSEEVIEEGPDVRVVDLSDFFLYPANSKSIDRATAVFERMLLTEIDLYDGIEDFGFDAEKVEELCALGPTDLPDRVQIQNEQDGVETAPGGDGFYEVFTMYTRIPRRLPGEDEPLPKHYAQDDFLVVLAPKQNIVLKMGFSPYEGRPYFSGGILPKKDQFLGLSLMGILEAIQTEANANIQFTIDSMNLTNSPTLLCTADEAASLEKQEIGPGKVLRLNDLNSVRPLEWDRSPLREGLAWQQNLNNAADALVSAVGQGQLQSKVRKQGEIDNLNAQVNAKFGLYLSNFQRTIVAELFRRLVLLKKQFGDVDEDGEDFTDTEGHSHKLTAKALRGKYNIVPVGTSLTYSPESRIEIGKQKQAVQAEYLAAKLKLPPDLAKLAWHGAREILFDLGERNPEAWIGEEPEEAPPQPEAPENGAQGQQGANPQQAPMPMFGGISNGTGVQ